VVLGSKEYHVMSELGAPVETAPVPLGAVAILNPFDAETDAVPVHVGVLGDGHDLTDRLQGVAGIEIARRHAAGEMTEIELWATGGAACAAVDRAVEACDASLVFHERRYGPAKRYADRPSLAPVSAREAGMELLRETLNREPRSALMRRHGGSVIAALVELAGLIAPAACYRLTPGAVDETADLLREIAERSPGG
jgi:hypothetical protein